MSRLLTAGISGTLLALSVIASAAPKGGGETDPSLPALLEPFVHYRVTYFSLPEEGATNILLRDVNKDGLAVGRYETPDGYRRAVLADSDGNIEDLNGVFNKALAAYPGWRFDAAYCINANGQVAGTLVPNEQARSSTSPDVMIIRGDLYADPSSITVVDRVFETGVSSIRDMNEAGDMLVSLAPYGGEGMHWLYRSPEYLAEQIEGPEGAEDFSVGYLNGAGQISMVAFFNERYYFNRKRYEDRWAHHVFVRESDGSLSDDLGYGPGSWWVCPISEDGVVYNPSNGAASTQSTQGIIHQLDDEEGWQPVSPQVGSLHAGVSKEAGNRGEVVIDTTTSFNRSECVYREGYGAYNIEVTSGLNGQDDVDFYNNSASSFSRFHLGISRPNEATSAGYICGYHNDCPFILTPVENP
jgi:hypothetical protein